jgi:hypothetical protein
VSHRSLRHVLAVAAAIVLIVAWINLLSGGRSLIAAGVSAALVIVLVLFEVQGYRPKVDRSHAGWRRTGERFVDPASGKPMDVYYNPDTGERDYRRSS